MQGWSEEERQAALDGLEVLDTPAEQAFDALVQAAARACGASMAAVTLLDRDRQWLKARLGLDVEETARDVSFCDHAVRGETLLVVPDATRDPRFLDNPLVLGEPHIRFYAGAVIRSPEGLPLGALCVLDPEPRPGGLTPDQALILGVLGDQVSAQLRLRQVVARQQARAERQVEAIRAVSGREERLTRALESAAVGWWEWDAASDRVMANPELAALLGLDAEAAGAGLEPAALLARVHPSERGWMADALAEAVRSGEPFREECRVEDRDGSPRWVSARGQCLRDDRGEPWRFPGVVLDVTQRRLAEERSREADLGRELAMGAARLGRWDHRPMDGSRFYDARALEILHLSADEGQDLSLVLARVHPDDRAALAEAIGRAVDPERTGPFRQVFRMVPPRSGEERWISAIGRTLFVNGRCTRFMGVLEDVTEAKRADETRQILVHELNHRVKNSLALVLGVVDASLRQATDPAAARADTAARIVSLGRAHDILTAQSWSAASVRKVVDDMLRALSLPLDRVELVDGGVRLGPKPALQLALALHELATNARKYGAMSNDTGRIALRWAVEDEAGPGGAGEPAFLFEWTERGGPPVSPPQRRGFGSRLTGRVVEAEFGGRVEADYAPAGLRWRLRAPMAGLLELGRADTGG